jgi:hypothetical protein
MLKSGVFVSQCLRDISLYTLSNPLRIESPHFAPDFDPISIEIDKGRSEFKTIDRGQLTPDIFLDIEAYEKELVAKFIFELVHDGLYFGAANSVRGLEFQQNRLALPDHRLYRFGIVHQGSLGGVQQDPGHGQPHEHDAQGDIVTGLRFLPEQNKNHQKHKSSGDP